MKISFILYITVLVKVIIDFHNILEPVSSTIQ